MRKKLQENANQENNRTQHSLINLSLSLAEEKSDCGVMNWVQRKIYLYNVTFGLYMLDWWERCLFNTLVVVLLWFVFFNVSRYLMEFGKSVVPGIYGESWRKNRPGLFPSG